MTQTDEAIRLCYVRKKGAIVDAIQLENHVNLVSEISKELAKFTAQIYARGGPVLPVDEAQEKLVELVLYGNKVPAVAEFLQQLYQSGATVLCGTVDSDGANLLTKRHIRVHLDAQVEQVLHACRSGDFCSWRRQPIGQHGHDAKGIGSATDIWTVDIQQSSKFSFPLLTY